jgi:hypothetical protein
VLQSDLHMGKSFEQKVEIVSGLKDRLASTQLMFATEAKGVRTCCPSLRCVAHWFSKRSQPHYCARKVWCASFS